MDFHLVKTALGTLIPILLASSELYPQVDSSKFHFFPHHLNDTWVYYVHNGVGDDSLRVRVISDSTTSEGSTYLRFAISTNKTNDPPTQYWQEYQKVDTGGNVLLLNGMAYSHLQFKANAQLGESWATGYDIDTAYVKGVTESSVFNIPATVKLIGHRVGTEGYGESYAQGFGIISRTGSYAIVGEIYLIAAAIGGVKYGDTILTDVPRLYSQDIPMVSQLMPNYPNPFNVSTVIRYSIAGGGTVELIVYDILGREVSRLVDEYQMKGRYKVTFGSSNLASGVYFCTLRTNGEYRVSRLLLQK